MPAPSDRSSAWPRGLLGATALAALLASSACLPSLPPVGASTRPSDAAAVASTSRGPVRLGKSIRGDLSGVLTFAADLRARGHVAVIPRVTARLDALKVDVGARVRAGDTLAELDRSELDQQVQEAQAAQASAEAHLAELKAGPRPEALALAQANQRAAQARLQALQNGRGADTTSLQKQVDQARAALDAARAALKPDPQAVAQADAAVAAAQAKLSSLQGDPAHQNDRAALDAARADLLRAQQAAAAARTPTGSDAAVQDAQRQVDDAQQNLLFSRLAATAFDLDQARALAAAADAEVNLAQAPTSPEEIHAAQAAIERAYAQAELARARLRGATLTAPIDGIVTEIAASPGTTVSPAASVLTLIPPSLETVVQADAAEATQVRVGQEAALSVEAFPQDAFSGTVRGIAPELDPRTRTVAIHVEVSDPQSKLRPGMFVQLGIQTGAHQGAVIVPREAVLRVASVDSSAPRQTVVYTVVQSRVHRQVVLLGASDPRNVEVVQGLAEGADLVLDPRPDFIEGELLTTQ